MLRSIVHALILIFAIFVVLRLLLAPAPEPDASAPAHPPAAVRSPDRGFAGEEMVIARDASGQFRVQARVNGEDTEFLVDTGADVVALMLADAERLGLDVGPDDLRPILRTASGAGRGAMVRLDRVELGDEEFTDVDAVVVDGLAVNLLGQSLLRRLGAVELRGDRMIITHRPMGESPGGAVAAGQK